jgi:hypothetical protein
LWQQLSFSIVVGFVVVVVVVVVVTDIWSALFADFTESSCLLALQLGAKMSFTHSVATSVTAALIAVFVCVSGTCYAFPISPALAALTQRCVNSMSMPFHVAQLSVKS